MNAYKFKAMLAEFSFLHDLLTVWESERHFSSPEEKKDRIDFCLHLYGKKFGFGIDLDEGENGYIHPYYLNVPNGIKIKRADYNLLAQTPKSDSYSWCDGGYHNYTHYYAIFNSDDDYSVAKLDVADTWANGSGGRGSSNAPTIREQLFTKKLDPDFVVAIDFQDTDANGNGETLLEVIIYKMSKFNLRPTD